MTDKKESRLFSKITRIIGKTGKKLVYRSLLLYYAYRRKETPRWAKTVILGVLGYFISIIDFIPDIVPGLGYTDDFVLIALALTTLSFYVNNEVRDLARLKMQKWFPEKDFKAETIPETTKESLN